MKSVRLGIIALAAFAASARGADSPLPPLEELRTFQLADTNLVVELVAAEPDVRAPVALAWDADGRMFVAEMTDYPSGPVSGRIRLLEDLDGDGRCERATVFATNLAFPNGVMAWRHGLLVTAAPDILFLADTNGDGRADVREKVLTGFAEGNQQLRVNGLFWGLDNWIYGANGRSDGEVKWAGGTPAGSIRRRDFRFRPDTKQFEAVAGHSQYGMGGDDWGNRFPVFNNIPVRHVVMDDRYLKGQMMLAGGDVVPNISPTNDGNRVFAITHPNLLIPQPIGFFTSACGPSVYRGDALPESLRGSYFVSEPVQNLVQRRVLVPDVSTFVAEYAHTNREFLASTDRWFHPVFTATGPDGALYVVDFYRDLVEHPHWVAPELRDKVDWRKGEEHGRIWRIRGQGTKAAKAPPCSRASDVDLVKALESANGWTRDTAHRLLVERAAVGMIDELERMARNGATAQSRVHALNILDAFWGDDDAGHRRARELLRTCLSDAEPRVREQAVRIAERHLDSELMAALLKRVNDDDARVRLQLACSAGAFPVASSRLAMLTGLARHNQLDPWQALAILGSAGDRPWLLGERLKPMLAEPTEPQLEFLERLAASVAAGTHGADLGSMSAWLGDSRAPHRFVLWASALEAASPAKRAELLKDFPGGEALASARDRRLPERVRLAAIRCSAFRRDALDALVELLASGESRAIQIATARAFFQANDAAAVKLVFARFHAVERNTRREIIASSVRRSGSASALLDAVEKHLVPLAEVDPAARHALEKFSDNAVKERARRLFASSVSADRAAVVEQFKPALKLSGDRARGAALFERACAVCHQMQGVGAQVGPDLSGIGQQPRETLLVQILDPSRQVLPDFVAYHAETKDGESYSGFVVSENAESVTLRRANEPDLTLPRARLAELRTNGKSMMPDGLEAGMSLQDMADLLEFLRRPDRTLFTQSP